VSSLVLESIDPMMALLKFFMTFTNHPYIKAVITVIIVAILMGYHIHMMISLISVIFVVSITIVVVIIIVEHFSIIRNSQTITI